MLSTIITIVLIVFLIILMLFLIRLKSPREIDDVNPEIPCSDKLIEKSDVLWVIPYFNEKPISENKEWCNYILSFNKTLGLHGVNHEYNEFETTKNQEYLNKGIKIFEECFGFKPRMFKSPQLKISENNKNLIKNNNMKIKGLLNQIFHKIYHCNNSGRFSNKFIDLF